MNRAVALMVRPASAPLPGCVRKMMPRWPGATSGPYVGADEWRAKRRYEASKADFSDAVIAECAAAAGCKRTVTFDRTAAATAGLELLS